MSWLGDALSTIQSVVLLQSKVEQLENELERTNDELRRIVGIVIQIDRRLVRLETIEEVRSGRPTPPRIEG